LRLRNASRSGISCRFASIDAHGVVVDGGGEGAEDARMIARAALQQRAASLVPLFEKVSRGRT